MLIDIIDGFSAKIMFTFIGTSNQQWKLSGWYQAMNRACQVAKNESANFLGDPQNETR